MVTGSWMPVLACGKSNVYFERNECGALPHMPMWISERANGRLLLGSSLRRSNDRDYCCRNLNCRFEVAVVRVGGRAVTQLCVCNVLGHSYTRTAERATQVRNSRCREGAPVAWTSCTPSHKSYFLHNPDKTTSNRRQSANPSTLRVRSPPQCPR